MHTIGSGTVPRCYFAFPVQLKLIKEIWKTGFLPKLPQQRRRVVRRALMRMGRILICEINLCWSGIIFCLHYYCIKFLTIISHYPFDWSIDSIVIFIGSKHVIVPLIFPPIFGLEVVSKTGTNYKTVQSQTMFAEECYGHWLKYALNIPSIRLMTDRYIKCGWTKRWYSFGLTLGINSKWQACSE